jgi:O-antigen ligase
LVIAGSFATMVFSVWHHRTGRKMAIVTAALVGMAIIAPVLYSAVQRRSVEEREGSSQDRELMESGAGMIVSDHPFGVGANRYVLVANIEGYSERAGVPWNRDNRAAPVHNSYYLVTAEMGWLGLGALIGLLVAGLSVAVSTLRSASPSLTGELAAGTAATILMVAIHAYYEWIFFIHSSLYFLALTLGLVAGLNAQIRGRARLKLSQAAASPQLAHKPGLGSVTT